MYKNNISKISALAQHLGHFNNTSNFLRINKPDLNDFTVNHNINHIKTPLSPLQIAAYYGQIEIIILLIQYGANINLTNQEGESVLYYALSGATVKHIEQYKLVINYLIEKGANLMHKHKNKYDFIFSDQDYLDIFSPFAKILIKQKKQQANSDIMQLNSLTSTYIEESQQQAKQQSIIYLQHKLANYTASHDAYYKLVTLYDNHKIQALPLYYLERLRNEFTQLYDNFKQGKVIYVGDTMSHKLLKKYIKSKDIHNILKYVFNDNVNKHLIAEKLLIKLFWQEFDDMNNGSSFHQICNLLAGELGQKKIELNVREINHNKLFQLLNQYSKKLIVNENVIIDNNILYPNITTTYLSKRYFIARLNLTQHEKDISLTIKQQKYSDQRNYIIIISNKNQEAEEKIYEFLKDNDIDYSLAIRRAQSTQFLDDIYVDYSVVKEKSIIFIDSQQESSFVEAVISSRTRSFKPMEFNPVYTVSPCFLRES